MKAWDEFLSLQEKELGKATVQKWLRPLRIVRFDACNLYLESKDSFQVHWFEEHIRPLLLTRFVGKTNKRIKVHLSVAKETYHVEKKENKPEQQKPIAPILPPFDLLFDATDKGATLENFIATETSLVAYKLLCELTGQDPKHTLPLGTFNPIFLHGPSGSGKTHLLMATANALRKHGINALYVRAETFTEHVVSAIRSSEMQLFRKAYRNIDALFIDDVEVFSRKGATQEELFHTFNTLHLEGKQIILSAKCLPTDLNAVEPRLISRFEWGIVLPLGTLKPQELKSLLMHHSERLNYPLAEKVIEFLIETFKSSSKSLLKALDALVLRSHMHMTEGRSYSLPLSLENTKHLLSDLMKSEEDSLLTPTKIIDRVAQHYGIRNSDILGKAQSRECTLPRQVAMYLCRKELDLPFMKIGDLFTRDHSTVMTSCKQTEKNMDSQPELSAAINTIKKSLVS